MGYKYQNLYQNLADVAITRPKSVALYEESSKTTYIELKQKVDAVAGYLQGCGVHFGDKVAMFVQNSSEFIISYLAITTLGGVAVPINTFLKFEELAYILSDCKAKILIASSPLSKELKKVDELALERIIWIGKNQRVKPKQTQNEQDEYGESLYLDGAANMSCEKDVSFDDALACQRSVEILKQPTLNDLVHIIYTSGTTGKPKGAMITYKNIISNLHGTTSRFCVRKSDRFLVFLPMFHSFTLTAMVLLPLYNGASSILIKSVFPFSNVLKQALLKRATVFLGIPSIYTAIAKAKIPWYFRWFNKIRIFVSGAAPLAQQTIDDFKVKFPRAKLIEGYGLSECSPIVSANLFEKQKLLSVGLPLDGYEVKIVDDEMVEVETGEIGEIIVKGDCVMQGYLGIKDDTTIINGWLRTGDLAKVDEDGFIFIVDRKKDLIISKGINIYPREIEEVIYKLESVEACAVIGVRDEHADEEVVAFIQPKDDVELNEKSVRTYLKSHLANYKLPKTIHIVTELPRNATGKVLKRVLKEQISKEEIAVSETSV
ncbi:long-chain-fatty-acid--CoA ligase [Campylobacter suis]|uniref:Long-chain-fatty-acid--CoA ligase n=1 Tax=Campylobacter suis TaxID=2790657 RepID=A0ABM8Q7Q1_9BACT|nr:long-chain-fatty-acid--CoA ligase [Campylobacter suis]CAD7288971.1 Long-chain-fatty-acid--CoA ligase [Campylobacter suis]